MQGAAPRGNTRDFDGIAMLPVIKAGLVVRI
jgi:hypothetical protein